MFLFFFFFLNQMDYITESEEKWIFDLSKNLLWTSELFHCMKNRWLLFKDEGNNMLVIVEFLWKSE